MRRVKLAVAVTAVLLPGAALAVSDADRIEVYHQFRAAFDAHRYQEALPLATKLVDLTQQQYGANDRQLINPLANLGTTQYRLHDYKDAEETYLKSVKIATDTGSAADRMLLRPLHGLGATYYATQQFEDASTTLQRALDLSRNLDGLMNPGQMAILDPLIASLVSLERHAEADREFQYAVRVAETAWGTSDVRVIRPVEHYARWLERVGRYAAARAAYAHELKVAEVAGNRAARLVIDPLRGIARSYRLEAVNGTDEETIQYADPLYPQSNPGSLMTTDHNMHALNPDGERALTIALQTIDKSSPIDHKTRGLTMMELGDWYLCGDQDQKSVAEYRSAWKELEQVGGTSVFDVPRQLAYRAPASSASRSPLAERDNTVAHSIDATFTVTRDGHTAGVITHTTDATVAQQKIVLSAVKRARYGPRLQNGEPVDTPGVTINEKMLSKAPRPGQPQS